MNIQESKNYLRELSNFQRERKLAEILEFSLRNIEDPQDLDEFKDQIKFYK